MSLSPKDEKEIRKIIALSRISLVDIGFILLICLVMILSVLLYHGFCNAYDADNVKGMILTGFMTTWGFIAEIFLVAIFYFGNKTC